MAGARPVGRREREGLLGGLEREAVAPGDDGARRGGGEPALERAACEPGGVLAAVGVVGRLRDGGEVALHGGARLEQVVYVGVVRIRLERGEHALRVPVRGVERDGLAQVVLGAGLLAVDLLLVGQEGDAVVEDLGGLRHEVEGPVGVGGDEGRGVLAEAVHPARDELGVVQRVDALAAHGLQDQAQAILLDGVERHVRLLARRLG